MQGNHGEDVKELYYYLDSTPTHSYMRALYKYPQAAYPYERLVEENGRRTVHDDEFELLDTGNAWCLVWVSLVTQVMVPRRVGQTGTNR